MNRKREIILETIKRGLIRYLNRSDVIDDLANRMLCENTMTLNKWADLMYSEGVSKVWNLSDEELESWLEERE